MYTLVLALRAARLGHASRIAIINPSQDDVHRPSANIPSVQFLREVKRSVRVVDPLS